MIFKQYYLACLSHASYLIADETTATAAIVDPQRDIQLYIDDAARLGVEIKHVFLTHFHADFVAGHLDLRDRTGALVHLGARASAEFKFAPMREGQRLRLGPQVELDFLETPGHTPEGVSILVFDLKKSAVAPHAVLTGDTLFIGDVGRPDLMASIGISAEELAGMLYDSLHQKLLKLPDETLVYPAHGAGSMCGKNLSSETFSTLGQQRATNYALKPMPRQEFIKTVTAEQPEAPSYFAFDAALNSKEHQNLDAMLEAALTPMSLEECLQLQAKGAQILDTRDADSYAAMHLAGSLNIGLGGRYATWCGTLLDRERPIVIVADAGKESEAAMRLGRIGFDWIAGYLEGGGDGMAADDAAVKRHTRIDAAALADLIEADRAPAILDVRTPAEFAAGHLQGAINLPLSSLAQEVARVPDARPLLVHCKGGYRSSIAISLLEGAGIDDLIDLRGGYDAVAKDSSAHCILS